MIVQSVKDAQVGVYSWGRVSVGREPISPRFKFDVENFRDPAGQPQFKKPGFTGKVQEVRDWIKDDPRFQGVLDIAAMHVFDALKNGRSKYCSIAFVDQHGKWISPAIAEELALYLSGKGLNVAINHFGL